MVEDFLGAVSFMTILGKGTSPTVNSRYFFGVTGLLVGFLAWVVWSLTRNVGSHLLGAILSVVAIVIITGGIHFDGLADSADGLLAHLERERRFEVMAEPAIGVFGILSVVLVLLLMTESLAILTPNLLFLLGVFSLSRTMAAGAMELFPYVRPGGIATDFGSKESSTVRGRILLVFEAIFGLLLVIYATGIGALVVIAAIIICMAAVIFRSKQLLGGYTGDVLGASIVVAEMVGLVAGAMVLK